jgi:hypothetical protein
MQQFLYWRMQVLLLCGGHQKVIDVGVGGAGGVIFQFSISCPEPTPHARPSAWSYYLGAWDGVGTARTTQSGCYGPEKLSRAARAAVGALPPSPEQRGKAAPLGKGVKPAYRAG